MGKGYTYSSLTRMKKFYSTEKVATMSQYLRWSHYVDLLKFDDINIINYYIKIVEEQKLTIRELRERIKSKEYERLSNETKLKLINNQTLDIKESIKTPIIIKNKLNIEKINEKLLQNLIVDNIEEFMKELGSGYCYIDKNIKNINHNKSIGIILTRKENKFVMEYCSDKRIIAKEYILL